MIIGLFSSCLMACSSPQQVLPREGGNWELVGVVEEFRMGEGRIDALSWRDYSSRFFGGGFIPQEEWAEFESSFSFMGWELRNLRNEITPAEDRSQWVWQSVDTSQYGSLIFNSEGQGVFITRDTLTTDFTWDYTRSKDRIHLRWQGLQGAPVDLNFTVLTDEKDKQVWQADHQDRTPNPFTAGESETVFTVAWQLQRL